MRATADAQRNQQAKGQVVSPTIRTALSISRLGLVAKFMRMQLRYLPDAEKILPTAICTPLPSKARFRRRVSKPSASSTHSMKP
ncbi:hypothetical protein AO354_27580, partial [Pseudomonas syringae pv. syringae]